MASYNSIHRQQLFHWIGGHIDSQCEKGKLTNELRAEYVTCLEQALKRGLWVKTPRDPDQLGDGRLVKVVRPISCFTEWSLGQSMAHTSRYGRLGLGFPKRFVLMRGGQPVTYVRDLTRNDPYTNSLKKLAALFQGNSLEGKIAASELANVRQCFEYLSHFNKRIRKFSPIRIKSVKSTGAKRLTIPKKLDPFLRSYGGMLHYLEEREWRIVHDDALAKFFTKGPGTPAYFLKFLPGKELFTVVLPDNATVSLALQNTSIRKTLFPSDAPHVTVLSLQDIGTF